MKTGNHTDMYGTKRWYLNGEFHREDGPAIIYPDGDYRWYIHGQLISTTQTGFKNYLIKENLKTLL